LVTGTTERSERGRRRHESRWAILSRLIAAILGGYAVAALAAAALTMLLSPLTTRFEATVAATLAALLLQLCACLWAFGARTSLRAWLGFALPAMFLAIPLLS